VSTSEQPPLPLSAFTLPTPTEEMHRHLHDFHYNAHRGRAFTHARLNMGWILIKAT
jgi:hypothetical protein